MRNIKYMAFESNITAYGDAIWCCFNVITTIGLGDYYVVTFIGRIVTFRKTRTLR